MKDVDITVSVDPEEVLDEMDEEDILKYLWDERVYPLNTVVSELKNRSSLADILNEWFDSRRILNKEALIELVKEEL